MVSKVKPIHTAIQFIEKHLKEEITVEDIAASAGYSLYHLIRTFNSVTHHTPYDYLIRRRLSESAKDLITNQQQILNIALDYRFNNHETFSRAFKRMFAMQPSQWRSRGTIPYRALMPAFSLPYLQHLHQDGVSKPQIIERGKSCLIGLMNPGEKMDEIIWESLKDIFVEHNPTNTTIEFFCVHTIYQDELSFFFTGVEVMPHRKVHPPLVKMELPGGTYAQFSHHGPQKTLPFSLDYIYHTWLVKTRNKLRLPLEIETFLGSSQMSVNKKKNWAILLPIDRSSL